MEWVHAVVMLVESVDCVLILMSFNETPKSLAKKILIQEHKLYPKAICKIFKL